MEAVITCNCGGVPARAKAAFSLKFKRDLPKVYSGKDAIINLRETVPNNSSIYQYLLALSQNHEKFAYYMEWNEDGTVTSQYNLLTGRKLA